MRKKVFASIVFLVTMLFAVVGWAADWFVRPAGGNYGNEDGTSYENAWDGFVNIDWTKIQPGDTLWLDGSATYREELSIGASGTVDNYITVRGDYNGQAEIKGSDVITNWSGPDGNGEYTATLASHPWVVIVDGVVWKEGSFGSLASNEWDWDSGTLYLGSNPSNHTVEAGVRSLGVEVGAYDYIIIRNISVSGCSKAPTSNDGGAIHLSSGAMGVIITNCSLSFSRFGVMDNGAGCIIRNCNIFYCSDGIQHTSSNIDIRDSKNVITNINWDGTAPIWAGVDGEAIGITNCTSSSIIVEENIISFCYNGIKAYTNTSSGSIVFRYNTLFSCYASGLSINGTTGGSYTSAKAYYNLIYSLLSSSRAIQFSSGDPPALSGDVEVINNTVVNCPWAYHLGWGDVIFKNNIAHNVSDGGYYVYAKPANSISASNNIYYDNDSGTEYWRAPGESGTTDYSVWQSQTLESDSGVFNPLLTSNYHLSRNSPCIDAGTKLSIHDSDWQDLVGNRQRYGTNPDIGCYERNTDFRAKWGGQHRWTSAPWGIGKWKKNRWTPYE